MRMWVLISLWYESYLLIFQHCVVLCQEWALSTEAGVTQSIVNYAPPHPNSRQTNTNKHKYFIWNNRDNIKQMFYSTLYILAILYFLEHSRMYYQNEHSMQLLFIIAKVLFISYVASFFSNLYKILCSTLLYQYPQSTNLLPRLAMHAIKEKMQCISAYVTYCHHRKIHLP